MIGLLGLDFFGLVLGVVTHLPAVKGMFYNFTIIPRVKIA
jgi:hypothetical protein